MSNFAAENPAFSGAFFARVVSLGLGAIHLRKFENREDAGYQQIANRRVQKSQDLTSKKGGICEKTDRRHISRLERER